MKDESVVPWSRLGLIAELAYRLDSRSPQFGKTVLQKMVFLLQRLHGVDCGYDFTLYTYGPFTTELLQDLALAESLKGVDVHPAEGVVGGYMIKPGETNSWLRAKAGAFLKDRKVRAALDSLVSEFGACNARELELISTIVYVQRDLASRYGKCTHVELMRLVREIKPRYTIEEVDESIRRLVSSKHIKVY